MTSPCAASSPRTGFGKWKKWTASPSEGACGAWPCLWAESGACPACDPVSHLSHRRLRLLLPDSLTTWEIHGVSLSKSTGAVTLPGPLASLFHAPWSEAPCLVLSAWYRKEGQRPGDVCMPSMGPEAREQWQAGIWVGSRGTRGGSCPSLLGSPGCDAPRPLICALDPSGLCVATPAHLRVFHEFHMHLCLPVSVRRFEQLELRPVLYNYLDSDLTVRPLGG